MINRIKAFFQIHASVEQIEICSFYSAIRIDDKTLRVRNSKPFMLLHKKIPTAWNKLWIDLT